MLLWHIWCYHVFFVDASAPAALPTHGALCRTESGVRQLAEKLLSYQTLKQVIVLHVWPFARVTSNLTLKHFLVFQKCQTERTPSERVLTLSELEARECLVLWVSQSYPYTVVKMHRLLLKWGFEVEVSKASDFPHLFNDPYQLLC